MATVFKNKIQIWSARIRNGPAAVFCRWWFGELKKMLPVNWQQRLQHASRRVVLAHEPGTLKLGVEENHAIKWLESLSLEQDLALQRQRVHALLEKHDVLEVPRFLLMGQAQVLRKELMLPAAAESNLQQVLAFEMDRQTPFRAADVYFTWILTGSDKESGQIRVDLLVVPRKPVDLSLDILRTRGLAASGVDVVDGAQTLGINMLPPEKRFRVVNPQTRLNRVLAVAALLLLILVMVQSLNYSANRVDGLKSAIAEVQGEAKHVQQLREQVKESGEAASFLTRRRAQSPIAVELLADVTKILPDDTYLDRLVISQGSVLMQGKSHNAQQLIEIVNKSGILENAAFRGSTRLDTSSGLEIFEINARVSAKSKP